MSKKYKACPFCRGKEVFLEDDMQEVYWVLCYECNAAGPTGNTKEEALEKWNRRSNICRRVHT